MKNRNQKKDKNKSGNNGLMSLSFGALNIADYVTTKKILNSGGEEYNPIVDFFIRKNCFGIFKTAATLAGMLAIYVDKKPKIMSKALLGLYGVVVSHNIKEIVQHKKRCKQPKVKQ
ncbi:MAG: DUF5658 family protein [Desulfobacterales bacterium]